MALTEGSWVSPSRDRLGPTEAPTHTPIRVGPDGPDDRCEDCDAALVRVVLIVDDEPARLCRACAEWTIHHDPTP